MKYMDEDHNIGRYSMKQKRNNTHNVETVEVEVLTQKYCFLFIYYTLARNINKKIHFSPTIDHDITIQVTSSEVLKRYTYVLLSRKKVIESKTVSLPDNESSTHTFSFTPHIDMTPAVNVLVYIAKNDTIWSAKRKIDLKGEFHNFISLSLSTKQVRPGQDIDISIKTNPKSYVGMLGIDESLLLLKSGNDIDRNEVLEKMYNIFWKTYPHHEGHSDFLNYWDTFKVKKEQLFLSI